MLDLTRIRDYGKEYVVYFRNGDELQEFAEEWAAIGGSDINIRIISNQARSADLCLFLTWRGDGRKHGWAWSDKSYCFDEHPEYEVHTLDDLRASSSDLGEIETDETSVYDLFIEAVCDLKLLEGDPCD